MTHKLALSIVVAGLLGTGLPVAARAADQYKIDLAHSVVLFRVMHLGIAPT